jgi:cyclic-di-GMP phosphodiesterase TipF (flagellum assembly factor)
MEPGVENCRDTILVYQYDRPRISDSDGITHPGGWGSFTPMPFLIVAAALGEDAQDMVRISTIFVAICMAMIAASLGLVLYAVAGVNGQQSAIVALAALTFMILYNAVSMRMRDRPEFDGHISDLSQGTADLARQVGDFGRRLAAIESRVMSSNSATQDRIQSVSGEISELGMLVNQLAESVAAHDDVLSSGLIASGSTAATETIHPPAPMQARPAPAAYSPPRPAPVAIEDDYVDDDLDALPPSDGGLRILAALKNAIDTNRIDIYLQPIVTLPQRKVRFYEAVTRLRDSNDQILTADDFIETAEGAGLMGRIDHMVMSRGVQVLQRLMVRNKDVGVFCNVAAATLSSPANFAKCLEFLETSREVAPSLILEFKQAAFRGFGPAERERLAALAQLGYRFSIDHVADLRMEPRELADRGVRYIKVPAALLLDQQKMASSDIHAADLSGLLSRFGIDLVADRIEGERAAVDLLDYDVRFGQGFLFAAPRPLRPENAPAAMAAPSAPAMPGKAPQEVAQQFNAPGKSPKPALGRSDQQTAIGNAALARRAVRPN